jgi:hypothetical protein
MPPSRGGGGPTAEQTRGLEGGAGGIILEETTLLVRSWAPRPSSTLGADVGLRKVLGEAGRIDLRREQYWLPAGVRPRMSKWETLDRGDAAGQQCCCACAMAGICVTCDHRAVARAARRGRRDRLPATHWVW